MKLDVKIRVGNLEHNREVIERLVEENIKNKLDRYLKKFDKTDAVGSIDLSVEKYSGLNENGLFRGKLQVTLDGKSYPFSREEFKKLDDLINHLFGKLKESLSAA